MINKIKKIKNLGLVFSDYRWGSTLPDFKRFNLFYGWNGAGKTTLSNLFFELGSGTSGKYPNLEYEIEAGTVTYKQGELFNKKVRVFNQAYISKNIGLLEGKANSIFILGEENKALVDEIQKDEDLLNNKIDKLKAANSNKQQLEKEKNDKFTDIARTISTNITGEAIRKYDKRKAEAAFSNLSRKEDLSDKMIQNHVLTLQQLEKDLIPELKIPNVKNAKTSIEKNTVDFLNTIIQAGKLCSIKTVEAILIERLKANSDISEWVEKGLILHDKYQSQKCEFCYQHLSEIRTRELYQHFNNADMNLKKEIDMLLDGLESIYSSIRETSFVHKATLYDELQALYQIETELFTNEKKILLDDIEIIGKMLKEKKAKTTEAIVLTNTVNSQLFISKIEAVNVEIRKHNQKTTNFKAQKEIARKALEKHFLSTIYERIKELNLEVVKLEKEISLLENGDPSSVNNPSVAELNERIRTNKEKILSSHKACSKINESLKDFLGRNEINFEPEEEGYIIRRNGEVANHLSESEETAIALVYFIVHLQDSDFDIAKGIVVIDDPISSLDSNSQFQAFSFIKNNIKNARQLFVFTHNFDFLRLMLNWMKKNKKETNYYMLKNKIVSGNRAAIIEPLDKLLLNYESEYQYLFSLLYNFKPGGGMASAYSLPNLVRKFLETFLMFRVPNSDTPHKKLEEINFDVVKKNTIYKFVNHQSHITGKGFDPSLVPEIEKVIPFIIEMIKCDSPAQYEILKKLLEITD